MEGWRKGEAGLVMEEKERGGGGRGDLERDYG